MKTRTFLILLFIAILVYSSVRLVSQFKDSSVTTLIDCQVAPLNLSKDIRDLYSQICSDNLKKRSQGIMRLRSASLQPSDKTLFLPLLSEVMGTDDYITDEGRRFYLAGSAGEIMAIIANVDAVPFAIKSLKSKKTVEIQAGLSCAKYIIAHIISGEKTNEFLMASIISLLPYIQMQTTNTMAETSSECSAFAGSIPHRAQHLEVEFIRLLPQPSQNK